MVSLQWLSDESGVIRRVSVDVTTFAGQAGAMKS
jgi:hypothetical protein